MFVTNSEATYMAAGRRSSKRDRTKPNIRRIGSMGTWTACEEVVRLTQGGPACVDI